MGVCAVGHSLKEDGEASLRGRAISALAARPRCLLAEGLMHE